MLLAETGLTEDQFAELVKQQDAEDFEGTVVYGDKCIEPNDCPYEWEIDGGGKYEDVESVYEYVLSTGKSVFLKWSCIRSGSYYSDYEYFDHDISVVQKHVETKEVISYI